MRLLRLPEVEQRVGLKKSTIYALIERGDFPPQVKVSARAAAWPETEITGWIERRICGEPFDSLKAVRRDLKAAKQTLREVVELQRQASIQSDQS